MVHQSGSTSTRETVSGTVEATNPKGLKVGGQWFNWSQYGPALPHPERGQAGDEGRLHQGAGDPGRGWGPGCPSDALHGPRTGHHPPDVHQGGGRVLRVQVRPEVSGPLRAGGAHGGVGHQGLGGPTTRSVPMTSD
jgi:hypothetical protein